MTQALTTLRNAGIETGTSSGIVPIPDSPPINTPATTQPAQAGFSPLLAAAIAAAATYAYKKEAMWAIGAAAIAYGGLSLYNSKSAPSTAS